jgi:tetratricopeptide (TPR) repeat protein
MAGSAVVTWLILKGCLNNQFTNWDDPGYIQDNSLIKDLSFTGLKAIFSTPVMGNYHPLTILSYAVVYSFTQLEPWLYHADNLALHIVDTLLVYWLVNLLTKRPIAAAITALLFGIHPMHVESVAWVCGRKDVLYGLFYIAACITYVYYLRTARKYTWYIATLLLFICALLAKPVAATLPLTLLLIDYFEKRTWKSALLIEKIPFFILSVILGVVAIKVQHNAGAMDMQKVSYNAIERIALGGYALITYLWKAAVPINLCNFYPYLPKNGASISFLYYLYPLAAVAITFVSVKYGRKNRVIVFGLLFFIVNIALLLQFLPVGEAILADRYTYMPYLGLFFIAGWYLSGFFEPGAMKPYRSAVVGVAVVYFAFLCYLSYERCMVWYDSITLWTDETEKEPTRVPAAYNNLGYIYYSRWGAAASPDEKNKDYDSAYYFLNKAIALKPDFVNPHISLGEMERSAGQYDAAKQNYFSAMKYNKKDPNLTLGLAILYYIMHNYDSSGYWFRTALEIDPSAQAHGNYANFLNLTGKSDSALAEYDIAIAKAPDLYAQYLNRGKVYKDKNRWDEALKDFNEAIRLDPDLGELYYERSLCYDHNGDKAAALHDADKAISLGYKVEDSYYERLKKQ